MGTFAPKFAELNDDVLFDEVWSREDKLSPRDRSLITLSALMASGILDFLLLHHIERARWSAGFAYTEGPRRFFSEPFVKILFFTFSFYYYYSFLSIVFRKIFQEISLTVAQCERQR